ncbi:hypothetical protein OA2633_00275 [Oceanicaulis sp. HTCC2633]|uniref:hypothetical protein n=1 Tax=Oceanicaulis sp. HTCC2633 TaxID=314254 RepID=UPI0000669A62|nr:hypothetical protein [Oceanicaulis sp. HTCC2633]EAP89182.1 hypothetical protein OA2633_00275 [Oceanicaulis sp. HTCC2633]
MTKKTKADLKAQTAAHDAEELAPLIDALKPLIAAAQRDDLDPVGAEGVKKLATIRAHAQVLANAFGLEFKAPAQAKA